MEGPEAAMNSHDARGGLGHMLDPAETTSKLSLRTLTITTSTQTVQLVGHLSLTNAY
jgi:hypothetical protein